MVDRSEISFTQLGTEDLTRGVVLRTGLSGQLAGEPINRAFGVGNMGGFRILGSPDNGYKLAVLFTTFEDPDWPDSLDPEAGRFLYYGDNKDSGRALSDTPKHGNRLLEFAFGVIHARPSERALVPPFFVTSKAGYSRDVVYHGLAVPGGADIRETEDLVAIWKTRGSERYQNYKALFTILDAPVVSANWIRDLREGRGSITNNAPDAWRQWVENGTY